MRLVLAALLCAAPAFAQKRLAVLEFRNKVPAREKGNTDSGYFTDAVRGAALQEIPGLQVMTRENLLVLLENSGKKLEDCEGECEVDTGRRVGADLVVSGELLHIGTNYKLNMRLHETATGWLMSAAVASGKSVDDLDASTPQAVARLLAPVKAPAPVDPAATMDVADLLKDPFAEYEAGKKAPQQSAVTAPAAAPADGLARVDLSAPVPAQSGLCDTVQRISQAAPAFDSLRSGPPRVNADGDRLWDSQVALIENQPCAIWAYADGKTPPGHRCKMVDLGACPAAEQRYRQSVGELKACLGSAFKATEDAVGEGGLRAELRNTRVQSPRVRLELQPVEGMYGRCDVNLGVEAR